MDQMLPSPGFSIPSLGTPLHQPEPDQEILSRAYDQPNIHQHAMSNPMNPYGMAGTISGSNLGMPSLMSQTPTKQMHTYAPSFAPPQSMIQPQTPVRCCFFFCVEFLRLINSLLAKSNVTDGTWYVRTFNGYTSNNGTCNTNDTDDSRLS